MKRNMLATALVLMSMAVTAGMSYADCNEYKIVDRGDTLEAVCVGAPLTEAEKKEADRLHLKELEQRVKELEASKEGNNQSQQQTATTSSRQRQISPSQPQPLSARSETQEEGGVVVESYDIKYIPSSRPVRNGREWPGEYSIKIVAKNSGRKGSVSFKMKQTDFSGFETESLSFSEYFEKDQQKTVTTHVHAQQVPFIQTQSWIIEARKH